MNAAGFSLIEVAVSLGIASFAVVGIVGLMPLALGQGLSAARATDAALLAKGATASLGREALPAHRQYDPALRETAASSEAIYQTQLRAIGPDLAPGVQLLSLTVTPRGGPSFEFLIVRRVPALP